MKYNIEEPILIAPKVYWVGYVIPDDPFQCHVYLIENNENSILIDPGSKITWNITKKKIEKIMPLSNIKYFIAHHQDPDIVSCMGDIFDEIGVENRYVVTHWRAVELLKHYNWGVEFYEVDKNEWKLNVGDVNLKFVFTPYLHFPGAFCTYLENHKILFSSDLFGAFTEKFSLYAKNAKKYFEQMKPFHTHYMPSKEILNYGLDQIQKYDIDLIAPQHGSIIKKELIGYIIEKLRKLNVGLFLEFLGDKDVKKLSKAHEILSKLYDMIIYSTGSVYNKISIAMSMINEILPIERIVCISYLDDKLVFFDSLYTVPKESDLDVNNLFELIDSSFDKKDIENVNKILNYDLHNEYKAINTVAYSENRSAIGICYILFDKNEILEDEDINILNSFKKIFNLMLLKEITYYKLNRDKKELLHKVITDSLTNVYNRYYLEDIFPKEFEKAKRHNYPLSVAMLDLDRFKKINDTYGHNIGDIVLKDFAKVLKNYCREGDFIFRYGGEEFVILMPFTNKKEAKRAIERIREILKNRNGVRVAEVTINYTFSAGIAQIDENDENMYDFLKKADKALYLAKRGGRDKIMVYE